MAPIRSPEETRWRQAAGLALMTLVIGACLVAAEPASQPWVGLPAIQNAPSHDARPGPAFASPGPVSVGFAQDMSLHHEQALLLARLAETRATPGVQAWAHGLASAQLREIGYMQGWLMLWNEPAATDAPPMAWMAEAYERSGRRNDQYERFITLCGSTGGMPGQVSPQEFERLAALRGAPFDRLFLQWMLRHHESALTMAQFAHEHAEHEVVRQLGATIVAAQREEWMLMARMLNTP